MFRTAYTFWGNDYDHNVALDNRAVLRRLFDEPSLTVEDAIEIAGIKAPYIDHARRAWAGWQNDVRAGRIAGN